MIGCARVLDRAHLTMPTLYQIRNTTLLILSTRFS